MIWGSKQSKKLVTGLSIEEHFKAFPVLKVNICGFPLALEDSYKLSLAGDAVGPTSCALEHQKNFMTVGRPR